MSKLISLLRVLCPTPSIKTKRIVIVQGHPDIDAKHFGHTLAEIYKKSAEAAGHEVKLIEVAKLKFPFLTSKNEFESSIFPHAIQQSQEIIHWAEHLVIIYPLWLGTMPAILKAFFEQTFRPGFAFSYSGTNGMPKKLLVGKSARIIVTMGMPAFIYRWYFRAHGLKNLKRNILSFCGVHPLKESLIGMIESNNNANREKWLAKMHKLGQQGK